MRHLLHALRRLPPATGRGFGLLLGAVLAAGPALAEGGSYPSMESLLLVGAAYLLLVPLLVSGLACGLLYLAKRQRPFRWGRLFGTALLIWAVAMGGMMATSATAAQENLIIGVAGILAFAGASAVGFAGTKPTSST